MSPEQYNEIKEQLENQRANFLWSHCDLWLVETADMGNWIWSDPDYGGSNQLSPYKGDCKDFCKQVHIHAARDKGNHLVKEYIGNKFTIRYVPWNQ